MRLIDADKLDDTIMRLNEEGWEITRAEYKRIDGVVFEMPTVHAAHIMPLQDMKSDELILTPCADAISRQEAFDTIRKMQTWVIKTEKGAAAGVLYENVMQSLDALPGVMPEEPTGHWNLDESDNGITCDRCDCKIYANDIMDGEPHYCPNCGAWMGARYQDDGRVTRWSIAESQIEDMLENFTLDEIAAVLKQMIKREKGGKG